MPIIQNKMVVQMEPTVQEVCSVIMAVTAYYPGEEVKVLQGIKKAIDERIQGFEELEKEEESGRQ